MKKLHLLFTALGIGLLLSACTLFESDDDDDNEASELIGVWRTDCLDAGSGNSQQTTIEFSSNSSIQSTAVLYSDADCTNANLRDLSTRKFGANEISAASGELWFTSMTGWQYQIDDADTVSSSNNKSLCSLSNWQAGVAKVGVGPNTSDLNSTTTRYVFGIPDIPDSDDVNFLDPELSNSGINDGSECYFFEDVDPSDASKVFQYSIANDVLTITSVDYDEDGNQVEIKDTYNRVE